MLCLVIQPANAAEAGAQYRTEASTEYGRAVVGQRVDARTVRSALMLTLKDMERYFGTAPKVRSAHEDAKDPRAGGATFLLKARGGSVKGLVTCRVGPQKTSVAVIYIRADAPAAEWRRLTQTPQPEVTAPSAGGKHPGPAKLPLHRYAFPDGTGSIGLADGWHTNVQSALQGIPIKGPDGAEIMVAGALSVLTPNLPLARTGQSLVAPFGAPMAVMQALAPQLSMMGQSEGQPAAQQRLETPAEHAGPRAR